MKSAGISDAKINFVFSLLWQFLNADPEEELLFTVPGSSARTLLRLFPDDSSDFHCHFLAPVSPPFNAVAVP